MAPTVAPTFVESWYESAEYASPTSGTESKFGNAVSMHTEFFVVGAPDAQADSGLRIGSISIFDAYSPDAIETVCSVL